MNDAKFVELGWKVLNAISSQTDPSELSNELRLVQSYIYRHPGNSTVKYFLEVFINLYVNILFAPELMEAFKLDESVHYYKELQISSNLPFNRYYWYAAYLPLVLTIPSEVYGKSYRVLEYVLKTYKPDIAEHPHTKAVLDFINQNPTIIRGGKDIYYDLNDEIRLLNTSRRGIQTKELSDFELAQEKMGALDDFINKRIGNIGELYAFNKIDSKYYKVLVARDIKNGFGYDIYYYDAESHMENLVEVKTTEKGLDNDEFSMSENEHKTMQACMNNPHAVYFIWRVRLDSNLNPAFIILYPKDDTTLVDIKNEGIEYKLCPSQDGRITFKRCTPNIGVTL